MLTLWDLGNVSSMLCSSENMAVNATSPGVTCCHPEGSMDGSICNLKLQDLSYRCYMPAVSLKLCQWDVEMISLCFKALGPRTLATKFQCNWRIKSETSEDIHFWKPTLTTKLYHNLYELLYYWQLSDSETCWWLQLKKPHGAYSFEFTNNQSQRIYPTYH